MRSVLGTHEDNNFSTPIPNLPHFAFVYLAVLAGFLLSLLITAVFPPAGEQATLTGQLVGEPMWVPEIVVGVLAGRLAYKRLPSALAFLVWIPPAGFLFWSAWSWQKTMAPYDSTWDTYFGNNCSGSECLYELFLTAPFYTSVAYSLGAYTTYLVAKRRVE
jgi:hypothetical protein